METSTNHDTNASIIPTRIFSPSHAAGLSRCFLEAFIRLQRKTLESQSSTTFLSANKPSRNGLKRKNLLGRDENLGTFGD